jgi:hypothetical protein
MSFPRIVLTGNRKRAYRESRGSRTKDSRHINRSDFTSEVTLNLHYYSGYSGSRRLERCECIRISGGAGAADMRGATAGRARLLSQWTSVQDERKTW